jgi:hypothetical protein
MILDRDRSAQVLDGGSMLDQLLEYVIPAAQGGVILVLLYVVAKLNTAVKTLNNRVNIVSQAQRQLGEELKDLDRAALKAEDDRLRSEIERDFHDARPRKRKKELSGTESAGWQAQSGRSTPDPGR